MAPLPAKIAGLRVICYSPIDTRHRFTGANERRYVDGLHRDEILYGPMAGLAICEDKLGEGVQLVGCDADWQLHWAIGCTSIDLALEQAEFEYEGISKSWVSVG